MQIIRNLRSSLFLSQIQKIIPSYQRISATTYILVAVFLAFVSAARNASAGSATWNLNPTSGDWNTATNWTPATVPNGPADTATFGVSNTPGVLALFYDGIGGSLTKIGSSTLMLSGANTYTGGTTIEGGKLVVSNRSGSGMGSGAVQVNKGTLRGRGTIAGAKRVSAAVVTTLTFAGDGSSRRQAAANVVFIDVTSLAGLHDMGQTFASPIWGDFNRDGYLDVFVDNRYEGPPYVYQNNGNGTFTDVFSISGITLIGDRQGSAWVDFDNDGDLDLSFIKGASGDHRLGVKKDELYVNLRAGWFRNIAKQAGVTNTWGRGRGVAWADYDNDGFVDLIVGNFRTDLILYRNNGDKTFSDVTAQGGLSHLQYTNCAFADYNNDGFQDITCVAPYPDNVQGLRDILLRNNGDGTFTDVSSEAGIAPFLNGECIAWGDYDNDGDLDLFVSRGTENDPVKQTLYRNNGNGTFTDVGDEAGVGSISNNRAAAWGDYNNDGYLDLYVVNSGSDPVGKGPNNLYRNNQDGTFTDVASVVGVDDLIASRGRGATWADYDNDGFLDLFVVNDEDKSQFPEGPQVLYRNQGNANHWLKVKLVGTVSNRQGLGVKVTVRAGGMTQYREANGAGGHFFSQTASPLHFGLGDAPVIDEITVRWPSGINQELDQVGVNQEMTITESP